MNYLQNERGNVLVRVGDQVENGDARFFVGGINESQTLCHLDKSMPWELLNENSPMAACIKQGNYSASVRTLKAANEGYLSDESETTANVGRVLTILNTFEKDGK